MAKKIILKEIERAEKEYSHVLSNECDDAIERAYADGYLEGLHHLFGLFNNRSKKSTKKPIKKKSKKSKKKGKTKK